MLQLSDAEIKKLHKQIDKLPLEERQRLLELMEQRDNIRRLETAREHFIPFVKMVWPEFIPGAHHNIMGAAFERVARGELKRLIINMAPRHTKSELASWLLPAWFLGKFPRRKVIQASNTEALAAGFGRRVRNLLDGKDAEVLPEYGKPAYQAIFDNVRLAQDSQSAAGWHTNRGGEYFAIGVNGKVTGKGGDIIIIDDPHSEQEAKQAETSPEIFDSVYDWYTSGPRQRLQPGGAIIIVMTRWSKRDLTGRVIKSMQDAIDEGSTDYDKWEIIELPALIDEHTETERPMWPGFWSLGELRATRTMLPPAKWNAQYQQKPTSASSTIFKRESWRLWGDESEVCPGPHLMRAWENFEPPPCDFILQSWDCAATTKERSNFNACTTWGVFRVEDHTTGKTINNIILLSAWKKRMQFPELKKTALRFYNEDMPDALLIEDKSAGTQLLQEFKAMGLPATSFTGSSRGSRKLPNDKVARANMIVDIFASGYVWRPARRFADEVADEMAEFPGGEYDDYVDSVVQAMLRFRAGGFIRTANDEDDDEGERVVRRRGKRYY